MCPASEIILVLIVVACDSGDGTREQIAVRFSVCVCWIGDLLRRRRETGSIAPKPQDGGRPPAFDEAAAVRVEDDNALEELQEAVGVACSVPVLPGPALLGDHAQKIRGGRPSKSGRN